MSIRALGAVLLALVAGSLSGCGSNEAVAPGPDPQTIDLGAVQVGVASAAGFKALTLNSPTWSPLAFTALYGSKLVGLREMAYNKIAFDSNRDGDFDIYVTSLDGSSVTKLTQNTTPDYSPSWSPDGTKIAFEHWHGGDAEICVMNSDGSGHTQLINNTSEDYMPDWSADGQKIVFHSNRAGSFDIYKMNTDGSSVQRLTTSAADDADAVWSPDGRLLAYTTAPASAYQLYVMNADGSGPRSLTDDAGGEIYPAWSPDGQSIVFASTYGANSGDLDLFLIRPDGSGVSNFTNSPLDESQPAWSPDGRALVYQVYVDTMVANLTIMNLDGTGRRTLTSSNAVEGRPSWCPSLSKRRGLIGTAGADNGSDPPFGSARPLAIVAVGGSGLIGAATITLPAAQWDQVDVAALENIGQMLAGARVTAPQIQDVLEDMGRGRAARRWALTAAPTVGAALIFFAGDTGRIASVIAASDTALGAEAPTVASAGERLILRGPFVAAFDQRDPARNLLTEPTRQVALDAKTGLVVR